MEMIRVGILGIAGVMLAIQLKQYKPEYSILIGFSVCLLIFYFVIQNMVSLTSQFESLKILMGDNGGYIKILLKVIGITYICEFCAGVCKDAGFGAISNQIEVFGKLAVLISGMPILLALIETIQGFGS